MTSNAPGGGGGKQDKSRAGYEILGDRISRLKNMQQVNALASRANMRAAKQQGPADLSTRASTNAEGQDYDEAFGLEEADDHEPEQSAPARKVHSAQPPGGTTSSGREASRRPTSARNQADEVSDPGRGASPGSESGFASRASTARARGELVARFIRETQAQQEQQQRERSLQGRGGASTAASGITTSTGVGAAAKTQVKGVGAVKNSSASTGRLPPPAAAAGAKPRSLSPGKSMVTPNVQTGVSATRNYNRLAATTSVIGGGHQSSASGAMQHEHTRPGTKGTFTVASRGTDGGASAPSTSYPVMNRGTPYPASGSVPRIGMHFASGGAATGSSTTRQTNLRLPAASAHGQHGQQLVDHPGSSASAYGGGVNGAASTAWDNQWLQHSSPSASSSRSSHGTSAASSNRWHEIQVERDRKAADQNTWTTLVLNGASAWMGQLRGVGGSDANEDHAGVESGSCSAGVTPTKSVAREVERRNFAELDPPPDHDHPTWHWFGGANAALEAAFGPMASVWGSAPWPEGEPGNDQDEPLLHTPQNLGRRSGTANASNNYKFFHGSAPVATPFDDGTPGSGGGVAGRTPGSSRTRREGQKLSDDANNKRTSTPRSAAENEKVRTRALLGTLLLALLYVTLAHAAWYYPTPGYEVAPSSSSQRQGMKNGARKDQPQPEFFCPHLTLGSYRFGPGCETLWTLRSFVFEHVVAIFDRKSEKLMRRVDKGDGQQGEASQQLYPEASLFVKTTDPALESVDLAHHHEEEGKKPASSPTTKTTTNTIFGFLFGDGAKPTDAAAMLSSDAFRHSVFQGLADLENFLMAYGSEKDDAKLSVDVAHFYRDRNALQAEVKTIFQKFPDTIGFDRPSIVQLVFSEAPVAFATQNGVPGMEVEAGRAAAGGADASSTKVENSLHAGAATSSAGAGAFFQPMFRTAVVSIQAYAPRISHFLRHIPQEMILKTELVASPGDHVWLLPNRRQGAEIFHGPAQFSLLTPFFATGTLNVAGQLMALTEGQVAAASMDLPYQLQGRGAVWLIVDLLAQNVAKQPGSAKGLLRASENALDTLGKNRGSDFVAKLESAFDLYFSVWSSPKIASDLLQSPTTITRPQLEAEYYDQGNSETTHLVPTAHPPTPKWPFEAIKQIFVVFPSKVGSCAVDRVQTSFYPLRLSLRDHLNQVASLEGALGRIRDLPSEQMAAIVLRPEYLTRDVWTEISAAVTPKQNPPAPDNTADVDSKTKPPTKAGDKAEEQIEKPARAVAAGATTPTPTRDLIAFENTHSGGSVSEISAFVEITSAAAGVAGRTLSDFPILVSPAAATDLLKRIDLLNEFDGNLESFFLHALGRDRLTKYNLPLKNDDMPGC